MRVEGRQVAAVWHGDLRNGERVLGIQGGEGPGKEQGVSSGWL